jgi:transposase-like protein
MTPRKPVTLTQAITYFSDPDRAFDYAVELRWPDGLVLCPRCGNDKHSFIKTRKLWFCKGCKKQFTVKVGTIFEDSALGLDKWMAAVWMVVNCRNGISSHELARHLGVTQKSAWFMLQRIRLALRMPDVKGDDDKMGEWRKPVEVDETYVGGDMKNMHYERKVRYNAMGGNRGKAIVMGILDRGSRTIRAKVIPNVKRETLQKEILSNVKHGARVYTDEHVSYDGLAWKFIHRVVNHTQRYVEGRIHTNGIENFWSLLKRGLSGTYVAVEPFHLHRYVDEQVFRFNNRKDKTDAQRFTVAMRQIAGKRLTFAELTTSQAAIA